MRAHVLLLAAVLVSAALAGCLGGDDDAGPELEQTADVGQGLGGIQGVVTDAAVQPVQGANVTLQATGEVVQTASDGSYAFSRVTPGEHKLTFQAHGFVSTVHNATVRAGEATVVDVILAHKALQEAYIQQIEMAGFVECGIGWKQTAAEAGDPLLYDSALAACAVPNIAAGGNATNDRFLHTFELEAPLHTAVYELAWDGGGTEVTSPPLRTIMEVQGHINEDGSRIMDTRGQSPILVRLTPDHWAGIEQNVTDRCQGLNGSEPDDTWCGYNFRDAGWPMVLRVFATGGCLETPASGCLVLQQEFSHYVSAFYNQPAPAGFSVTGAG